MAKRGRPTNQEIAQRKMDAGQENQKAGSYNGTKDQLIRCGAYLAMREAWESVRTGKPFDQKLLDKMPIHNQDNYERFRLYALSVKVAGLLMPVWNNAESYPPKIASAIKQAHRIEWINNVKENEFYSFPRGKENWLPPVAEWDVQSSESQPTIY